MNKTLFLAYDCGPLGKEGDEIILPEKLADSLIRDMYAFESYEDYVFYKSIPRVPFIIDSDDDFEDDDKIFEEAETQEDRKLLPFYTKQREIEFRVVPADYPETEKSVLKAIGALLNIMTRETPKESPSSEELRFKKEVNHYRENCYSRKEDLDPLLQRTDVPLAVRRHLFDYFRNTRESQFDRNLFSTAMAFPWNHSSSASYEIKDIRENLNRTHSGMESVKEKIIRFAASETFRKSPSGMILCLTGDPGTGKTSIAESIAQAMNRPFRKISMSGVSDASELLGTSKVWVGSSASVITAALCDCGVSDPVLLLDEVDKIGEKHASGNPENVLLDILDPDHNKHFYDHYLQMEIDLSRVTFICTANDESMISGILRDRMEIIRIPSYSSQDKLQILKKHILPSVMRSYDLSSLSFIFLEDKAEGGKIRGQHDGGKDMFFQNLVFIL